MYKSDYPLHYAVYKSDVKIIKQIVNSSNVNNANSTNETLLHIAVQNDNCIANGILKFLIDCKVDTDIRNDDGRTPIFYCVEYCDNPDILKMLIEAGAKYNVCDNDFNTILHVAIFNNNLNCCEFICKLENFNFQAVDNNGSSALHLAAKYANICEKLIEYKVPINSRDNYGNTPLHYAAKYNIETCKLLVKYGADFTICNYNNETPLYYAILYYNLETCIFLVDIGSALYANAIKYISKSTTEIFKYFINCCNLDLNVQDNNGYNLLHLALIQENCELVFECLDNNVNIHATDNIGNTPLYYAFKHDWYKKILQKGADINVKNIYYETPLFRAVEHLEALPELLQLGADPNARNIDGATPIFYAEFKACTKLVEFGANINAQNNIGHTVLFNWLNKENVHIITKLLELGANPNVCNYNGESLLYFAARKKCKKIYIRLVEYGADFEITNDRVSVMNELEKNIPELYEMYNNHKFPIKGILDNFECPICYEISQELVVQLPCKHVFHNNCINDWNSNTCPMCRQEYLKIKFKN